MKSKLLTCSLILLLAHNATAQTDDSLSCQQPKEHSTTALKFLKALIPSQIMAQNAGNMGAISAGIGWDYGKHSQWETNLMIGLIPKHSSKRAKITLTLKENFLPWKCQLKPSWAFNPLSCGIYINSVFGHEFWTKQPSRYPKGYYWLSTKYRFNIFIGQRLNFSLPDNRRKYLKSISLFYEISTCDLYARAFIKDKDISLTDILGLSLGIKLQLF